MASYEEFSKLVRDSISDQDQRVFIKMCMALGHSPAVIHGNLTKICGFALSTIKNLGTRFRSGNLDTKDRRGGDHQENAERAERLERIKEAMEESRHWSTRALSSKLGIPLVTVKRYIRNQLGMHKIRGK